MELDPQLRNKIKFLKEIFSFLPNASKETSATSPGSILKSFFPALDLIAETLTKFVTDITPVNTPLANLSVVFDIFFTL